VSIQPSATDTRWIWLVRHAPTDWTGRRWCGRSDPPLTTAGLAAAEEVASTIAAQVSAGPKSRVVLSSPLRRAIATARPIADRLGASIEVDEALAEIDFGVADGLTWEELAMSEHILAAEILAGGDPDWPRGETAAEIAARAAAVVVRIRDAARSNAVVVVSHGGLLRQIAQELGVPEASQRLAPASAIRVDPGRKVAPR